MELNKQIAQAILSNWKLLPIVALHFLFDQNTQFFGVLKKQCKDTSRSDNESYSFLNLRIELQS